MEFCSNSYFTTTLSNHQPFYSKATKELFKMLVSSVGILAIRRILSVSPSPTTDYSTLFSLTLNRNFRNSAAV